MNRLPAFFKARELFAHQRFLIFWLVALVALALPWLWLALADQEPALVKVGNHAAIKPHETRLKEQAP
jgi:hypothetical protein